MFKCMELDSDLNSVEVSLAYTVANCATVSRFEIASWAFVKSVCLAACHTEGDSASKKLLDFQDTLQVDLPFALAHLNSSQPVIWVSGDNWLRLSTKYQQGMPGDRLEVTTVLIKFCQLRLCYTAASKIQFSVFNFIFQSQLPFWEYYIEANLLVGL